MTGRGNFSYLGNMFSWLFGKKKEEDPYAHLPVPENANWAFLCADMHSHFIPGIDDGAKTIEDSIRMLRRMSGMGYKTVVTTPHVMVDFYPNTRETIENGLKLVQQAVKENNIDITVRAAAEYYMDEYFIGLMEKEPLLTIRDKEVLVEFSMLYEPPMLFDVVYRLQSNGYRPIIAHPERYLFFHKEFSKYSLLKDRGCLLQLNMLSVAGHYGKSIKTIAEQLLARNLYDYCGSDMHHEKHAHALKHMANTKDYHTFVNYPFLNSKLCI
jgi:protein-tyrosine phosphatase